MEDKVGKMAPSKTLDSRFKNVNSLFDVTQARSRAPWACHSAWPKALSKAEILRPCVRHLHQWWIPSNFHAHYCLENTVPREEELEKLPKQTNHRTVLQKVVIVCRAADNDRIWIIYPLSETSSFKINQLISLSLLLSSLLLPLLNTNLEFRR